MKLQKLCFAVAVLATMIAIGATCAACTNASVTGVWGFQIGTSVGQFKADGAGNITAGSATINQNGTVITVSFTGTYSVAGNCTGKLTLNVIGGGTITANFVLDSANKGAQIIDTTPGVVAEGPAAAEGLVSCGLTGKKVTFAALLLGKIIGGSNIAYVAQVTLDGKGNVSGNGTFDVGGTFLVAKTITGTYTESANCTGTIQMTPKGSSTLNFAFVVVNAGKELLLVDTDSNASVAGYMQH
jgi:hypothetical protein